MGDKWFRPVEASAFDSVPLGPCFSLSVSWWVISPERKLIKSMLGLGEGGDVGCWMLSLWVKKLNLGYILSSRPGCGQHFGRKNNAREVTYPKVPRKIIDWNLPWTGICSFPRRVHPRLCHDCFLGGMEIFHYGKTHRSKQKNLVCRYPYVYATRFRGILHK